MSCEKFSVRRPHSKVAKTFDRLARHRYYQVGSFAFFEFHLAILPEAIWLEIQAPAEAAQVLDELVGLPNG
jgi:hypothetical protein